MRTIKFRYRYEQTGVDGKTQIVTRVYTLDEIARYAEPEECEKILSKDEFTGLLDKHGKEIYEGDIVKSWDTLYGKSRKPCVDEVKWSKLYCGFSPFCDYDSDCGVFVNVETCEVIGNIHENPELLDT